MDLAEEAGQLREAMATRAPIEQAKGVIAVLHGVSAERAYADLRAASMNANVKLRDLAAAVMAVVAGEDLADADENVRRAAPVVERTWSALAARGRSQARSREADAEAKDGEAADEQPAGGSPS